MFIAGIFIGIVVGAVLVATVSGGSYSKGFEDGCDHILREFEDDEDGECGCNCENCICDQEPKLEKF
jgi:hypothetical protein